MSADIANTTLASAPYYDDFDETKKFHRVLFRPSFPVQARELTQLQTILQNQIERFGDGYQRLLPVARPARDDQVARRYEPTRIP